MFYMNVDNKQSKTYEKMADIMSMIMINQKNGENVKTEDGFETHDFNGQIGKLVFQGKEKNKDEFKDHQNFMNFRLGEIKNNRTKAVNGICSIEYSWSYGETSDQPNITSIKINTMNNDNEKYETTTIKGNPKKGDTTLQIIHPQGEGEKAAYDFIDNLYITFNKEKPKVINFPIEKKRKINNELIGDSDVLLKKHTKKKKKDITPEEQAIIEELVKGMIL